MAISLRGTVTTQEGLPVEHAQVRLIGPEDPFGSARDAALHRPGALSWTRSIAGYFGNRWNCWQKFVMNQVAGITWAEFKDQVVAHNPTLRQDRYVFQRTKTYKLPQTPTDQPNIVWSRVLTGFSGNRWQCWTTYVQGKVENLTWNEFMYAVLTHNPVLQEDGNVFQAHKTYLLPENVPEPDEIVWTRRLKGFYGNRWQCWETYVRDQVRGITWVEFMTDVVARNPALRRDGYVFLPDKAYVLPANPPRPSYYLFALTDSAGHYAFDALPTPGDCELVIEAADYFTYRERLSLSADTVHDVTLIGTAPVMVSDWEGYATAPDPVRRLIDQALAMLGDDPVVYDSLSRELQDLTTGHYYPDPDHFYHKDIVCADLITICLHAAGVDYNWSVTEPPGTPFTSTHAANYYRPRPGHPKLREVADDEAWLPGDILIYWNGNMASWPLSHVNLYIGPYSGTDLSGNVHPSSRGYDVVNASIDHYDATGAEVGTAIRPITRRECVIERFGYQHVLRMRHVDLWT